MKKLISIVLTLILVLSITLATVTVSAAEQVLIRYEAEKKERWKVKITPGSTIVDFDTTSGYVIFSMVPRSKGLIIRYACGDDSSGSYEDGKLSLYINNVHTQDIILPSTGGWGDSLSSYSEVKLTLNIPRNASLKLQRDRDDTRVVLDYVDLERDDQAPPLRTFVKYKPEDLKQVCIDIAKGMQEYAETIDVAKYNLPTAVAETIKKSFSEYSYPNLSHVKGFNAGSSGSSFTTTIDDTGSGIYLVNSIRPKYSISKTDYLKISNQYEAAVSKMLATIPANASDVAKVIAVNDYIASITTYSTSAVSKYSSSGVFLDGAGVCKAYTLAFIDGMNRVGIESKYIVGNNGNHAWAMVNIDNKWYHVDPTWNDTTGQWHNYCLLSDDAMSASGHYSWYAMVGIGERTPAPEAKSSLVFNYSWEMKNKVPIVDEAFIPETPVEETNTVSAPANKNRIEAERSSNVLTGNALIANHTDASEGKAVVDIYQEGDSVTLTDCPAADTITVRYAKGSEGDGVLSLYINQKHTSDIKFSNTGGWDKYKEMSIKMDVPNHANMMFRLDKGDLSANIDRVDFNMINTVETAPVGPTATPTASKVLVNGKAVSFDAYTINGNNYFKLRDLAKVVSSTGKQFAVGYDNATAAITLTSGKAYIAVGGELSKGDGKAKTAAATASKIYVNGKETPFTAYIIGGNNYFKLRDVAKVFNIGVGWNGVISTITVDTSVDYTE